MFTQSGGFWDMFKPWVWGKWATDPQRLVFLDSFISQNCRSYPWHGLHGNPMMSTCSMMSTHRKKWWMSKDDRRLLVIFGVPTGSSQLGRIFFGDGQLQKIIIPQKGKSSSPDPKGFHVQDAGHCGIFRMSSQMWLGISPEFPEIALIVWEKSSGGFSCDCQRDPPWECPSVRGCPRVSQSCRAEKNIEEPRAQFPRPGYQGLERRRNCKVFPTHAPTILFVVCFWVNVSTWWQLDYDPSKNRDIWWSPLTISVQDNATKSNPWAIADAGLPCE